MRGLVFLSGKREAGKTDTLPSDSKFKYSRVILRGDPVGGKAKTSSIRQHTSLGFAEPGKPFFCVSLCCCIWDLGKRVCLCSEENASQAGGAQGWP